MSCNILTAAVRGMLIRMDLTYNGWKDGCAPTLLDEYYSVSSQVMVRRGSFRARGVDKMTEPVGVPRSSGERACTTACGVCGFVVVSLATASGGHRKAVISPGVRKPDGWLAWYAIAIRSASLIAGKCRSGEVGEAPKTS